MKDVWTAQLPTGKKVKYSRANLVRGKVKITAQEDGNDLEHSHIVEFPVDRRDVETFFLCEIFF